MVSPYLNLPLRTHAQAVEDAHDQRRERSRYHTHCRDCGDPLHTSMEHGFGICRMCARDRAGTDRGEGRNDG